MKLSQSSKCTLIGLIVFSLVIISCISNETQYQRVSPRTYLSPKYENKSFKNISMIYGDLPSGELYGTTAKIDGRDEKLFFLNIVDEDLIPVSGGLLDLVEEQRVDPRFFLFPDGTAGVLLEATGKFYRLTEVD